MKPPPFEYLAVDSVDAAVAALADAGGDGKIIAGGQSLMPMLNFRLIRPSVLVDINRIPNMAYVRDDGCHIRIGALTRHYMLQTSELVAAQLPVLHEAMQRVAHLAIRNRGTIGGSLSHADPAAELPMMSLLLDAQLDIRSGAGRRTVAARDFFLGALTTSLEGDDMIVEIEVPKFFSRRGWAFEEVARRSGDFALACVAVTTGNEDGKFVDVRIGMTGIGETPVRADAAEALLEGQTFSDELVAEAINVIRASVEPNSDLHASSDYRRHLVGILAERAIRDAWRRAMEGDRA